MPGTSPGTILRHVRGLALPSAAEGQTDAQLLQGLAQRRDEAAFAALMQRHGSLVWGVGRIVDPPGRITNPSHAAPPQRPTNSAGTGE